MALGGIQCSVDVFLRKTHSENQLTRMVFTSRQDIVLTSLMSMTTCIDLHMYQGGYISNVQTQKILQYSASHDAGVTFSVHHAFPHYQMDCFQHTTPICLDFKALQVQASGYLTLEQRQVARQISQYLPPYQGRYHSTASKLPTGPMRVLLALELSNYMWSTRPLRLQFALHSRKYFSYLTVPSTLFQFGHCGTIAAYHPRLPMYVGSTCRTASASNSLRKTRTITTAKLWQNNQHRIRKPQTQCSQTGIMLPVRVEFMPQQLLCQLMSYMLVSGMPLLSELNIHYGDQWAYLLLLSTRKRFRIDTANFAELAVRKDILSMLSQMSISQNDLAIGFIPTCVENFQLALMVDLSTSLVLWIHSQDMPKYTSCKRSILMKSRRTLSTSNGAGRTSCQVVLYVNGSRTMGASSRRTTSINVCMSLESAVDSQSRIVHHKMPKLSDFGAYCSAACASLWPTVDYPSISGHTPQSMRMIYTIFCLEAPTPTRCHHTRLYMGPSQISHMYVCGAAWPTVLCAMKQIGSPAFLQLESRRCIWDVTRAGKDGVYSCPVSTASLHHVILHLTSNDFFDSTTKEWSWTTQSGSSTTMVQTWTLFAFTTIHYNELGGVESHVLVQTCRYSNNNNQSIGSKAAEMRMRSLVGHTQMPINLISLHLNVPTHVAAFALSMAATMARVRLNESDQATAYRHLAHVVARSEQHSSIRFQSISLSRRLLHRTKPRITRMIDGASAPNDLEKSLFRTRMTRPWAQNLLINGGRQWTVKFENYSDVRRGSRRGFRWVVRLLEADGCTRSSTNPMARSSDSRLDSLCAATRKYMESITSNRFHLQCELRRFVLCCRSPHKLGSKLNILTSAMPFAKPTSTESTFGSSRLVDLRRCVRAVKVSSSLRLCMAQSKQAFYGSKLLPSGLCRKASFVSRRIRVCTSRQSTASSYRGLLCGRSRCSTR